MLNLYYGRASINKDRFLFDRIADRLAEISRTGEGRVLLVVPDQFTLQAERNAFEYLDFEGLMDLEVLSQARLGERVLSGTGDSERKPVDKYGRHMLLAKIIAGEEERFTAFNGMGNKHAFISMVNDLISEMKQFNAEPSQVMAILETLPEKSVLGRKLADIGRIYSKYEELIKDKYIDTEGHLDLIISKISSSSLIAGAEIWIDGFDFFTPKNVAVIEQLMLTASNVNIILTMDENMTVVTESPQNNQHGETKQVRDRDLFKLSQRMMRKFIEVAEGNNLEFRAAGIDARYGIDLDRAAQIKHLEKELNAYPGKIFNNDDKTEAIELCRCSNFYSEAESVAVKITELTRERHFRYKDILVICNDMDQRGSVIKRVFAEYDIPVFMDRKRGIKHNPCIEYIQALMDVIGKGWRFEDVFRLIKTGLSPVSQEDGENLENYAFKYRIKGSKWKTDFKYGVTEIGDEELAKLNMVRMELVELLAGFEKEFKKAKTAAKKTEVLYDFLANTAHMPGRAEESMMLLRQNGRHEYAEETAQIWDVIVGIMDQLVELSGNEDMTAEEYTAILGTGFEDVEIGLLPPTMDQVLVGTMQRTRPGGIKALFVMGANDGVLPAASSSEGILNEDEKALLLGRSFELCKNDDLRMQEERLAIYRTLSRPSELLWIGYAASDLEGKELKPSLFIGKLKGIFPELEEKKDVLNRQDSMQLISNKNGTLRHLSEELRRGFEQGHVALEWQMAYRCLDDRTKRQDGEDGGNTAGRLQIIKEGMIFDNRTENLDREYVKKLYGRGDFHDITVSPSRIENFSKCPFAYFIGYGLRADERRAFEIAGREIGDIYHECLMKLGNELTTEDIEITAPESAWMTITEQDCEARVGKLLSESAENYRDGIFDGGEAERYRQERIRKVCAKTAWVLIDHVRRGRISKMLFETAFGSGQACALPPIQIDGGDERVLIEGKIDRIDMLPGEQPLIKIIDYKSGNERFSVDEAIGGWRLQLLLYLKAATAGLKGKPAGVFYFGIDAPLIEAAVSAGADDMQRQSIKSELSDLIRKKYRMDGVIMNEESIIEGIGGEFTGYSDIIPVRRKDDGGLSGPDGKLLSREEFDELQKAVDHTIEKLCERLTAGAIDITPKRLKNGISACTYCKYKSICNFDQAFEGCRYISI